MATAATSNSKPRAANHIHRPIDSDVLAQQPKLKRNQQQGQQTKSGKDLVYLPAELTAKYYSRLTQPGVMLGPSDITIRQMSGFLAYTRMRFQELRDGTHKTKIGKKQIPRRGKPFSQYGKISV